MPSFSLHRVTNQIRELICVKINAAKKSQILNHKPIQVRQIFSFEKERAKVSGPEAVLKQEL